MKGARCQHKNPAGIEQLAAPGGIRLTAETLRLAQAEAISSAPAGGA